MLFCSCALAGASVIHSVVHLSLGERALRATPVLCQIVVAKTQVSCAYYSAGLLFVAVQVRE